MPKHIVVIGSGFSGLSAACALAKEGFKVTLLEKNESAGGRASVFSEDGFVFDMGPSWYWMPDVFEWFFDLYGYKPSDFYELVRLDPAYRIYFSADDFIDMPASLAELYKLFEQLEPGSTPALQKFLKDAAYKYKVGMQDMVFKPCNSVMEFAELKMVKALFTMQLFTSLRNEVQSKFKSEKIRKILEFPVYFLGALPSNTPALYSILNYADLVLGTWYPKGGMYKIIEAMQKVAEKLGVEIRFNSAVTKIHSVEGKVKHILIGDKEMACDAVVASADYNHVEEKLLGENDKNYDSGYWDKKVFAPSAIIYYLGIKGKVNNLLHHNLFFDQSFEVFADEIYTNPRWPSNPLFYVCVPSKTDETVAPPGDENMFILIPVASGLTSDELTSEKYFQSVIERIEKFTGEQFSDRIIYKKPFTPRDFEHRYNAYKGNAYGLANTLKQTAIFKPKMHNKTIKNLVYAGQLTVPGPGMPPAIISGYVAAGEIKKMFKSQKM
ncbi:MAG: phytoene desaturase [Chitinophagales bacterium]|jgi:phytoene desaturase|nr:phytoene desaturase [Bacteroidota bacterium]MBK7566358.1 phytoene desaturase [Bacteroidota bacterium]MBP9220379.1 phytoene desaturase [Chitinophagales bacterium]